MRNLHFGPFQLADSRQSKVVFAIVALLCALSCGLTTSVYAQILIGQTSGFTGPVAAGVDENTQGALLWLEHTNAKGGIYGEKIKLISLDDKFDPALSFINARRLIESDAVLALFLGRGTPHTQAVLPLLKAHRVPLIAPSTGAMLFHYPVQRFVFNVRAPYQLESEKAIVHQAASGKTRIAVVTVDDTFGEDALQGAQKGFAKVKLTPAALIKADRNQPDYASIVPNLIQATPEAVLWIGSGAAVAQGVKALRKAGSNAQVITLSNNASGGFIKSLGEFATGTIVTQVFPHGRFASPQVRLANTLAKTKGIEEVSPAMLEGFSAAQVLVEGLRLAGPQPTRAKLLAAMERIKQFDLGGYEVSFSAGDHTGLTYADLSIIDAAGRFR